MKIKPTFFNTRTDRLHHKNTDTNNLLFTIFFNNGAEISFVLRDLKKNNNTIDYIYSKINSTFTNITEIETSKISLYEYKLLKTMNVPSIVKLC